MLELIKILLVVLFIVFFIWRKWDLGLNLVLASILLGLLFGLGPLSLIKNVVYTAVDRSTLELVGVVIIIIILGRLLKDSGNLTLMSQSMEGLVADRRVALVIPPALIGLLPMPGGAMFSAPMVQETGEKLNLTPQQKTFFNYWFRHLWEYWWPLYPGLIMEAVILQVSIRKLMAVQWPLTLVAIFGGVLLGLVQVPKLKREKRGSPDFWAGLWGITRSIWPVLFIIGVMIAFRVKLIWVVFAVTLIFLVTSPLDWRERWQSVKEGFSWRTILLLVSVMIFKGMLEASNALTVLPNSFQQLGLSPLFLLFSVPFLVGLLTGVNQAYIGISFPLLLPFMGQPSPDLSLAMFAYVSGFMGVLLSPVHLCLSLTKDYFNADFAKIYKLLIKPVLLIVLFTAVLLVVR